MAYYQKLKLMKHDIARKIVRKLFVYSFTKLSNEVHETAQQKGWWDTNRNDGESIALIHSELSEALEGLRKGNPPDDKIKNYSSVEVEMADTIIRIMDLSSGRRWNVAKALVEKINYNKKRSKRHGGKRF